MREQIDMRQFQIQQRPLPNAGEFEQTVQNYSERGWTPTQIALRLYRTQNFNDIYAVASKSRGATGDMLKVTEAPSFKALLRRVEACLFKRSGEDGCT